MIVLIRLSIFLTTTFIHRGLETISALIRCEVACTTNRSPVYRRGCSRRDTQPFVLTLAPDLQPYCMHDCSTVGGMLQSHTDRARQLHKEGGVKPRITWLRTARTICYSMIEIMNRAVDPFLNMTNCKHELLSYLCWRKPNSCWILICYSLVFIMELDHCLSVTGVSVEALQTHSLCKCGVLSHLDQCNLKSNKSSRVHARCPRNMFINPSLMHKTQSHP